MMITNNDKIMEDIQNDITSLTEDNVGVPEVEFTGVVGGDEPVVEVKPEPELHQLHDALDNVEDVFDRALAPYMVIGANGKGLYDHNDPFYYSKELHIGVRRNIFTGYVERTFKELLPKDAYFNEDFVCYKHNGVDIRIDLLPDGEYFDHPDVKGYNYMYLPIPNPFMGYYEAYMEVKE